MSVENTVGIRATITTRRRADATSSNDRARTRHLTRAYTGATRARVAQPWTRRS
jgi:hypothetical protein